MRKARFQAVIGICGLLMGPSELIAAGTQPTAAKWVVDAGDTRCLLTRQPTASQGPTLKVFVNPIDKSSIITLLLPDRKSDVVGFGTKAELELAPSGRRFQGSADGRQGLFEAGSGIMFSADEPELPSILASSTGLTIWVKDREIGAATFANAKGAMKALQDCNDDLLQSIGVDPKLVAAVAKPPQRIPNGPISQWISPDDYPADALQANAEGNTTVVFTVGVDGRGKECSIVKSAGFNSLDMMTCYAFLSRGKFHPATDRSGKAIEAPVLVTVRWVLPLNRPRSTH